MSHLLSEIRRNPLLWLLVFVPVLFACEQLEPESHTLLFVLSVLAIVPLAALLSHATEFVAAKTGDTVGGLLNATLGNLTELVIALTALRAGEIMLVKASLAGAVVTSTLFMLGASFLLGGLEYHVREYNRVSARLQSGLLFLAMVGLLIPSAVSQADTESAAGFSSSPNCSPRRKRKPVSTTSERIHSARVSSDSSGRCAKRPGSARSGSTRCPRCCKTEQLTG
jgi:Ca2+:H+ antiporter